MVVTYPLISKFSSPSTNYLVIVPSAPITISITVTIMFLSFFISLIRSRYLSLFPPSFNFTVRSARTVTPSIRRVLFFCWLSLGLVVWLRLGNLFIIQNPWEVCASHSPGQILCCPYSLIAISFTFPSGSLSPPSRVLFFCANLRHSLIMWLIVSSLFPYNLH